MKRNPAVELIRIWGSLLVLLCHTNFMLNLDMSHSSLKVFYNCVCSDPVAIFWLITGFYIFSNEDYVKLWKHTAKKILIPAALLYLFYFYLGDFVIYGSSFTDSILKDSASYKSFFYSIFTLYPPLHGVNHTWYIFSYILVILFYPMWKGIADYLDKDKKRENVFLVISFILLFLNDCLANRMLGFSFHGMGVLIPSGIFMLWGHIIYKRREAFKKRYILILAPVLFIALNLFRTLLIQTVYVPVASEYALNTWQTWIGLLIAILFVAFSFSAVDETKDSKGNRIICLIATFTFPYYLVHPVFVDIMEYRGIYALSLDYLISHFGAYLGSAIFMVAGTLALIIFVTIFELIKRGILRLFKNTQK